MSCQSCNTKNRKPNGCKSNGICSSGGCNKLEVYDWLANIDLPQGQKPYDIYEVRFKNSRKNFFRNSSNLTLQVGDVIVVEAQSGYDVGVISVMGELAKIQVSRKVKGLKPIEARKIIRIADDKDVDLWVKARSKEKDLMYQSRVLALNLKLKMKISDVEFQGDLSKATFYYTAEGRIDFRQLIKDMAGQFRIRIEMKQIGARQESSRLGGIGSCGRELCCSTWLSDFRSVSTSAARYQQLSLNPQKLAGQCGKLKCCLNYELDMYLEGLKEFPRTDVKLKTKKGDAYHIKTDVFKKTMWYSYAGESNLYSIAPERAKEIIRLNKEGKKPQDLASFKTHSEPTEKELGYSNVVGEESVKRFDSKFKKTKKREKKGNKPRKNEN
tara:strand:- start:430 stop:1578 length:1149 start_codon:yes stop_codon:yes gene_type:complete